MRVSDSLRYRLFQMNVSKVGQQLDDIEKKISTQKNINAPSDDPIKYATSIQYDAELELGTQYNNNLQRLGTLVGMYDTSFASISSQLNDLMKVATNFDSMGSELRQSAVQQINGMIEQLVTVGNTKLGNTYIFGGKEADVPPFQLNNDYSVTYTVGQQGEDATKIYVDKAQTGQYGVSGRAAFYDTSKVAFGNVANVYTGDIYSNTDSFAYVIDTNNNAIVYTNSATPPVIFTRTLTSGVYTGGSLAKEIQNQLGANYSVAFDSTTRKFSITNNTGAAVTFNWSTGVNNAASVLGFDAVNSVVTAGGTEKSDLDTGRKSFLVEATGAGGPTTGALGSRATYRYSTNGGATWTSGITVNTGGADTTADITIDATTNNNNTIYRNGAAIVLTSGTYTGATLAVEIQDQLNSRFIVNASNNTLYVDGAAVTLNSGDYATGAALAAEIENQLGAANYDVSYTAGSRQFSITNNTGGPVTLNWSNAGATAAGLLGFNPVNTVVADGASDTSDVEAVKQFAVTYDALTRKVDIRNNAGAVVTFNWSNAGATAGGVLGYDNADSVISDGASDVSDYDAGMFIDGAGVANATNNRIKLLFGTTGNNLVAGATPDTFQIKDLSVFELLKNLKDAFVQSDDPSSDKATAAKIWVSKNIKNIDAARELTTKNNGVIAFQGTLAKTMIANNKTKDGKIQTMQADLVNADMSELATEFSALLNTYQALLSTLAKMQSVSILNYLK